LGIVLFRRAFFGMMHQIEEFLKTFAGDEHALTV
jgi:hypothetical protein